MFRPTNPENTVKSSLILITSIYVALSVLFISIVYIGNWSAIPLKFFTADPAHIFEVNPLIGVISNLGVLLWCSTACICFFAFFLLKNHSSATYALFLLTSGILSTILLVDDLFMIHEYLVPHYLDGTDEYLYTFYLLYILFWGYYFWGQIMRSEYWLLLLAFLFLGGSVIGDLIFPYSDMSYFIEDALKFFGIVTWFIYFARLGYNRVCFHLQKREV